ncbi:hypothetical protein PSPO01_10385 [Paraphaeosphaeria sporulosa]
MASSREMVARKRASIVHPRRRGCVVAVRIRRCWMRHERKHHVPHCRRCTRTNGGNFMEGSVL